MFTTLNRFCESGHLCVVLDLRGKAFSLSPLSIMLVVGLLYVAFVNDKRCLLLGRKVMTNLDSIFKSRDITLPTNVHLVKSMVFPVVMYGCESWTVKKAECQRIDAFELWFGKDSWESLGLQGDPTSPF